MMLPVRWTGPPVGPQVKEWKPRALAVASKMRSRALPDVPTMAEIGYPDIEGEAWVGNTPEECATKFKTEIAKWAKVIRQASIKPQ